MSVWDICSDLLKFTVPPIRGHCDKLMDSANYALVGLVFAYLITDRLPPVILILGLVLYAWLVMTALNLKQGGEDK